MAAYSGFKIISVDYRMPPDHPYPAGLDDCIKVWKTIAETNDPKKLGLFGSSAGAGMTVAIVHAVSFPSLSPAPTSTPLH